jgi:hypothetical protein
MSESITRAWRNRKLYFLSLKRPDNYSQLSPREQWEIDKELGILDWDEQ